MTETDYDRTPIDASILIIDTSNAASYVIRGVFREEITRFFIVRAVIMNVNGDFVVRKSEDKYYVKVTNPCVKANQVTSPTMILAINYWIKDPAETRTLTPFQDTTTTAYGN